MPRRFARRLRAPRSLGAKLVLILTIVGMAGAIGITVLLAAVITPSFDALEARAVRANVERTHAALADAAAAVETATRDQGDRVHGDAAIGTGRADREPVPRDPGIDGVAYVDRDGTIRNVRWRGADGAGAAALRTAITRTDLARIVGQGHSGHVFARLGEQVAALGVAPLRGREDRGAARGFVVMARLVTGQALSDQLHLAARIDRAARGDERVVMDHGRLDIAVPIRGADGRTIAAARFAMPREAMLLGRRMLSFAVAGSTLLLLILLLVLRRVIARLVLQPLRRVERHMEQVRASGVITRFDDAARRDEFGSLGRSLDAMLAQLEGLREQVEAQGFALGRSESAVAVMHNVRNALTPISTILGQGIAQPPPIDRATVARALAELGEADCSAERRARLAAFAVAAFAAEAEARETMRGELRIGREAMTHVLDIIGQQQRQAHERPPIEPCDLGEIVARNAAIARYADSASIAFSFPAGHYPVCANRVILSQVIGNLLGNAAEAITATGRGSGSIGVTIHTAGGQVVCRIRDDGEGFAAATGAMLFQRGFSTRAHKSGGYGLHWSANAMIAMDGTLRLDSEGSGRGAIATLALPVVQLIA